MSKNSIGEKISALRKQHGLSQKDLADKLCVSNKTVSKWECGNGDPDIGMLKKLSAIFGVSIDYLLDNDADEAEPIADQAPKEAPPTNAEKAQSNKKRLVTIISSIATAMIIVFLACFFLIPRSPRITESADYIVDEEHSTIYCVVDNDVSVYSIDGFNVPMFNSWQIYRDTALGVLISDKTVSLQTGNNIFYVVVENYAGQSKVYTLTIRRKPLYTVTFDTKGGEDVLPKTIMEGEYLDIFTPTRDGYIFSGWDYDFNQPILSDTIISANWIAKELSVTYHSNNASSETKTQNVLYDSHVVLLGDDTFSMIGHTLSTWNTKADGTGIEYSSGQDFANYNIPNDIELYAQWTINKYKLSATLNFENAGSIAGTGTFEYNSTHTISANTNNGYSWIGWYDSNNELVTTNTQLEVTIQDKDMSYYAKWDKNSYTVNLDVNGGNELTRNDQIIIFDSPFSLPVPTRTEATFVGWYIGDVQYTDSFGVSVTDWNIADNATVYAHWNINKYTVSVTNNNEKGGSISGGGEKEYGSTVVLTANENAGYSFVGWYQGNELLSDDLVFEFSMPNRQLNYIAKWQANHYSITLNANNGESNKIEDVIYDNSFIFSAPEKVGYTFAGWFNVNTQLTDELGAGLNVWNIADDIEITAKWEVVTYTISYSLNGGNVLSNAESYTIEDLDITITNPTRKGYDFKGWITPDNYTPNKSLVISAGSYGNKVFAAVWEEGTSFVKISTVSEFLNIANNLNGFYYLANDIDFDGTIITGFGDENNPFTGVIDGKGYKIYNLTITDGIIYNNQGTIKNLEIDDATADYSPIARINNGVISKCKLNIESAHSGIANENNGIIEFCIVDGKISSSSRSDPKASGIANKNAGLIQNCIVHASVTARASALITHLSAAGISANCTGTILNCVVTGDIYAGCPEGLGSSDGYNVWAYRISGCDCNKTNFYLETQSIKSYVHELRSTAGRKDLSGISKTLEQLMQPDLLGFSEYVDEIDILFNNENVWVFSDNEYPKLYWE